MKLNAVTVSNSFGGRSPRGERGLKWKGKINEDLRKCRSPRGERGLKFRGDDLDGGEGYVAPLAGSVD